MTETAEVPDTFIHTRAGARFQPEALRSASARHRLESRPAAEEGGIDRPPNQTPSTRNVSRYCGRSNWRPRKREPAEVPQPHSGVPSARRDTHGHYRLLPVLFDPPT